MAGEPDEGAGDGPLSAWVPPPSRSGWLRILGCVVQGPVFIGAVRDRPPGRDRAGILASQPEPGCPGRRSQVRRPGGILSGRRVALGGPLNRGCRCAPSWRRRCRPALRNGSTFSSGGCRTRIGRPDLVWLVRLVADQLRLSRLSAWSGRTVGALLTMSLMAKLPINSSSDRPSR